jgi:hypothetical protein
VILKGLTIGPVPITLEWEEPTFTELDFRLGTFTLTLTRGRTLKMKLTLPDDSQIGFVLPGTGKDAKGNPVPLKGTPTVAVSDPKLLTVVQPDPTTPDNPLSGVLKAAGPLGTAQFTVTDAGEGTAAPLLVIVDVEVVAGELVSLGDPTFGPVTKQPAS